MKSEEKFWLIFWSILSALGIILVSIGVFNGYLNDKRDETYASKGLQPYTISTCREYATRTEWHDAGWNNPNETRSITVLATPKGN